MQSSRRITRTTIATTATATVGSKITVKCDGCGTEFLTRRCKVETSKRAGYNTYCNRQCYLDNSKFGHNGKSNEKKTRSRYLNCYRCRHCDNWIPHKAAIMHTPKNNENMTYPICPNNKLYGCGNVRLAITPRTTRFKTKYRELKRQEEEEEE